MIPTVVYQIIACVDSRLVRNMMSTYNLRFYEVSKTETGRLFATPETAPYGYGGTEPPGQFQSLSFWIADRSGSRPPARPYTPCRFRHLAPPRVALS